METIEPQFNVIRNPSSQYRPDNGFMTLSERIIEAMDASRASVKDVATACKISYQAVRKWRISETQSLDGKHLVALAKLTGYETEWLMMETGPKIRIYAKNAPQALTLKAMQKMPEDEQYKIPEVVGLFTEHKKKGTN